MRPSLASTLALLVLAAAAIVPPPAAADDPEVRAIWVDSFNPGLRSPAQIDALVARARAGNLNTIVAQVRRNAQGLYAASPEGWVENYVPPPGFDPLQDLLDKAHAVGIEVHAWVNIGPVYTGHPLIATAAWPCRVPCDPNHVFNQRGWGKPADEYWLTRTHPSFTAGTLAPFLGERISGGTWFMDLGHPAAAEHVTSVLVRLLQDYDVDGIHLDYIRFPEMPIASPRPPGVGLPFSIGYNPTSVKRFNAAFGRPVGSLPDPWDASFSQWRRDQVTAFVRRLYLELAFVKPQAKLSAALITFFRGPNAVEPRTFQQTEAYYRVFQDWNGWMDEGILDLSIPMVYKSQHIASHLVQWREWIEFTKDAQYDRQGAIGQASYMNSLENTLVQIAEGRAPSAVGASSAGFNFFSYNATNMAVPPAPLRPNDEFFRALSVDGAYAPLAPFPFGTAIPEMPWKSRPRAGHLLAQIIDADGKAADGARVVIEKQGGGPHDATIEQFADGNGYVGGVDLHPGAYRLFISTPGGDQRVTIPQPVVPGRVTRLAVDFSRPALGPRLRPERVMGAHEGTDQFPDEASAVEEWQAREPRPEDIPPLVRHFVKQFSAENNFKPRTITPASVEALKRHAWRGNARELKNTIERLLIMVEGDEIRPEHLVDVLRRPAAAAAEVARVTRKGGRVALTTWLPDSNLFKMFLVMKPYMPPPPSPAPPSPFEWGKAERVRELLGSAFDLRFEKGTSFYREPSGEAAWNTFSKSYGPTKALAGNLDENRRAELRRDFIAFHDGFPTELGICVPREYLLTFGTRR